MIFLITNRVNKKIILHTKVGMKFDSSVDTVHIKNFVRTIFTFLILDEGGGTKTFNRNKTVGFDILQPEHSNFNLFCYVHSDF